MNGGAAVLKQADVVILGGGPAGSAAANRLAAAGLSAVLLERSGYAASRFGEVLAPRAVALLDELGVRNHFLEDGHLPSPGLVSVWGGATLERSSLSNAYGDGWHLDRSRFDELLARGAAAFGAALYTGVRLGTLGWDARREMWSVEFSDGGSARLIHARFLVDATGRVATLASRLGAQRERVDRLVAVAVFYETPPGADPRMLVEAAPGGWWYSARLPSNRTVVAHLTDADLIPRGRRQLSTWLSASLRDAPRTFQRVGGSKGSLPRIASAASTRLLHVGGQGWLAVGDAAAAFDPLSAIGVTKALDSGVQAAQIIIKYLEAGHRHDALAAIKKYDQLCNRLWNAYLTERKRVYGREQRWPDSVFWRRRAHHAYA